MNRRRIMPAALALILLAGCRAQSPGEESQETVPVMVVAAAPATITPMISTLRALGVTVANHHVTIRAPAAGRLSGMSLKNGDQVRKGQRIGYVVNREIEAAQAGLAIARKLDPHLNMWATAEPVVGGWIAENLGPRGRIEDVGRSLAQVAKLVADAPPRLERLARLIERETESPPDEAPIPPPSGRMSAVSGALMWIIAATLLWIAFHLR